MRKLKVAEFTGALGFGGTEKTILNFARNIDRERFDLSVAAIESAPESGAEEAIRALGVETAVCGPDGLRALLEDLRPDVFHIHRAGWSEPGHITAAREAGVPVVVEHNVFGRPDGSHENAMIDCHIFVSYSCAWRYQMWIRRPLAGPRFEVIYNPVDIDGFDRYGFDGRDFSKKAVGRIGRADNSKWDMEYLEALGPVAAAFPDFEFHVVGMTPEVRQKLDAMGLSKNVVEYPMSFDEAKMMEFYSNISALAHLAEMGESFGLVLAEAMAAKLPVVTHATAPFKDSAQTELVNTGYNGLVATDPQMYADALIALLSAPANARQVGLNGYEKARACYNAPELTRGLEDIFTFQARLKGIV